MPMSFTITIQFSDMLQVIKYDYSQSHDVEVRTHSTMNKNGSIRTKFTMRRQQNAVVVTSYSIKLINLPVVKYK